MANTPPYPALSSYADTLGTSLHYMFSKSEIEPAYKIAKRFWEDASTDKKKIIPKYIRNLFAFWKLKHGLSHLLEEGQPSSFISKLSGTLSPPLTEEARIKRIKNLKAWECTPSWENKDPINFLFYLWVNDHWKLNFYDLLLGSSWLIIKYSEKNIPEFRPAIISRGLWLSEIMLEIEEERHSQLSQKYKKATKKNYNFKDYNIEVARKKDERNNELRRQASTLLANGKTKNAIISIISKNKKLEKRTVRRALESHESGLWIPKKKK